MAVHSWRLELRSLDRREPKALVPRTASDNPVIELDVRSASVESSSIRKKRAGLPTVGIALGAGGAKGVAHIPMLEALDELGVTPARIAGCSIGAVIGAMYASGLSAAEIKARER